MGRTLIYAVAIVVLAACSPRVVYVPVKETRTVMETRHDTVVAVALPSETGTAKVRDTTATAETSVAVATASYDGSAQELTLSLQNKTSTIPVQIEYVERIIRDSIPYPVEVTKEVPIYRAPWYTKALGAVSAAAVGLLLIFALALTLKH